MKMIGGNTTAAILVRDGYQENDLGERIPYFIYIDEIKGWLDLSSGDSKYTYGAKLQESTHVFIADFYPLPSGLTLSTCSPSDVRLRINGLEYDVLLIDDPMGLHQHWEIYLKFVG